MKLKTNLSLKVEEGDLVQQAVGTGCPDQAWGGRLVRYHGQEGVQVVLEQLKVPRVLVSQMSWKDIKSLAPWTPRDLSLALFTVE